MEFNHPVGDYHVHPDFSIDAKGSLREYCDRAIELGLSEIIFTTHVDSSPAFDKYNYIIIEGQKKYSITATALTQKEYEQSHKK